MKPFPLFITLALVLLSSVCQSGLALADDSGPLDDLPSLLTPLPATGAGFKRHEFWATWSNEPGVEDRVLLDYQGRYDFNEFISMDLGASLSAFDQWGLSLLGVAGVAHLIHARSEVVFAVQQERWPAWQVTENRIEFYLQFKPISSFSIALGAAYRAPIFDSVTILQSLSFAGTDPEVSLVYRIEGRLFELGLWDFSVLAWNYDRMRLYTYDNIHFTLEANYQLKPDVQLLGEIGTAAKGISGGVLSWEQSLVSLGLRYEL